MIGPRGTLYGRISRKSLRDIHVDYYIDFVCVHKGNPVYGFIIVDNNTQPSNLEQIQSSPSSYRHFELYTVTAEWIIAQASKPDNIVCEKICLTLVHLFKYI